MSGMKKVSIIIPAFNEESTIMELLDRVQQADSCGLDKEIIIVDDGSSDSTLRILSNITEENVKVIFHRRNQGKGAALRTGFGEATGEIIIIQDADLEYSPEEYPVLLEPILSDKADVVYGSRFLSGLPHRVLYYWHGVGNRMLTTLSNMLTDINLTDMETCYKVFTKSVLDRILAKLRSNSFGFEPEFTARIAKLEPRPRIYEVGISYTGRTYKEGKKIGWRDGMQALGVIVRVNLFG